MADHRPAVSGGVFAEESGQLEIRSRGTAYVTGIAGAADGLSVRQPAAGGRVITVIRTP